MDLIAQLTETLGIESPQAEALAGGLLGTLQAQMADKVGGAEAGQMADAIPELSQWKASADTLLGQGDGPSEGGGLGGLATSLLGGSPAGGLGALASGLLGGGSGGSGGLDVAFVTNLLGKLNLNPTIAGLVAPIVLNFLKERLPEGLVDKLGMIAPLLSGGGGVTGMLGGK